MNKNYQEMTKKEQAVINNLQVLEFVYINDKFLTIKEARHLLSSILKEEDRAVRMGLQDSISPVWIMEKERIGLK